ncbi:phosphatidylcholine translocator ABCB4-like [Ornithodoros turicata]|uniref:phosphatidylcholine translocator ABCB4-like n=1 Tax=Ornithodoros turicata TaxID=34597 RepID=UPI0031397D39
MSVKPERLPAPNGLTARVEDSSVTESVSGTFTSWASFESEAATGDQEVKSVEHSSFRQMFRFSTMKDRVLTVLGCLVAVLGGVALPAIIVLIGGVVRLLVAFQTVSPELCANKTSAVVPASYTFHNGTLVLSREKFLYQIQLLAFNIALAGLAILFSNAVVVAMLEVSATKQCFRVRQNLMRTVLHQDMEWFDGHLVARGFAKILTQDLELLHGGLGENLGLFFLFASTSVAATVSAFWHGWELTLVLLALVLLLAIINTAIGKLHRRCQMKEAWAFRNADAVVESTLRSIKTIIAYGGQQKEVNRYDDRLKEVEMSATRRGIAEGATTSLIWVFIYAGYALNFWYGVWLLIQDMKRPSDERSYDAGIVVTVFFSVLAAALSLRQALSCWEILATAKCTAGRVFNVLQLKSQIDSSSSEGLKPDKIEGSIHFKSVNFSYPSRSTSHALRNFSLNVSPGQCVALVGDAGCGKSTVLNLIERFYDVTDGEVLVDDRDIKWYNVGWLRGQLGVVSQEPVMFHATVAENIRYGLASATHADIQEAAIMANAHDFVIKLPKRYDTLVGGSGCSLTASQVRRIAIARALVRNPKILILDDPAALTHDVDIVQAALLKAREGRTTVITSSRLSTVRMANKILVMKNGRVVDKGSHKQLVKKGGGPYLDLLRAENAEDSGLGDAASHPSQHADHPSLSRAKSSEVEQKAEVIRDDDFPWNDIFVLAKCHCPVLLFCGCVTALLMCFPVPAYALVIGELMQRLSMGSEGAILPEVYYGCLLLLLVGILAGIGSFVQASIFSAIGAKLTLLLRKLVFAGVLRQDVSWIDQFESGSDALSRDLFVEIDAIQRVACFRLAVLCQAFSTLIACTVLCFYWPWQLGLIVFTFIPLCLALTFIESRLSFGPAMSSRKALEKSTKVATEAIQNIHTVASLHQEEIFCANYLLSLAEAQSLAKHKALLLGITYGMNQCAPCLAYSISFYYGSFFVAQCDISYGDLIKIVEGVLLGIAIMGQAVRYTKNCEKAGMAADAIFKLLDRCSKADLLDKPGTVLDSVKGSVAVKDVSFRYPSQPEAEALKNVSFAAEPGQTVALLGPKLSGKTACLDLVERFHDVTIGEILLDNVPTTVLNLAWMRRQLGYVCDPPLLSGYTIAENIAYGDNDRQVSRQEVVAAAQKAEAHRFIARLPQGYDTRITTEGNSLSRIQMRRIALARALLRDPKVLLIDDTVAHAHHDHHDLELDEEAIQESVPDRTCIVVANKASAVMEADKIFVLRSGRVVERGCHDELMPRKGVYYRMFKDEGVDVHLPPDEAPPQVVKFSIIQDEIPDSTPRAD